MILSLAHFCEIHGPTAIFCTQAISSHHEPSFVDFMAENMNGNSPEGVLLREETCASCQFSVPTDLTVHKNGFPILKTQSSNHKVLYISTRRPMLVHENSALKHACVRSLSCELLPGKTGPILFGDATFGYTIAYVFRLADPYARGLKRWYSLICLLQNQANLSRAWKFIIEKFEILVHRLDTKSKMALVSVDGRNTQKNCIDVRKSPKGFLRKYDGSSMPQSLAKLVDMQDIFVQIHASFAWILSIWGIQFGRSSKNNYSEFKDLIEMKPRKDESEKNEKNIA
ncbi:hypothetical protein MERGE_003058 [Pneumocystis wakefieldiae]|uniref:UDENN FLCN/SMCR8-type domain-containing protein n=1 Tax=Pneumocystis wakefieldiae TaxID=38082 RepID=A0A899FVV2_9ASCO|nr:hypothetical protein MERGE_003058 [Pneumocystis wakefieldiae]